MSVPAAPIMGAGQKVVKGSSRRCPTSCGATISGRDPHPMCIMCMGAKHAQAALADPQVCAHCSTMPVKILERRLRVAVTGTDGKDPSLAASDTAQTIHATHQPQALSWADSMEEVEPIPPLFDDVFAREEDDDADGETGSDILDLDDMEEGEEDSTFPTQSRPPSSTEAAAPVDNNLYEVCKWAAAKLNIPRPAAQDTEGATRDLYDGKRLLPACSPAKQLLPAVPACMAEMSRFWSSPFRSKVTTQGSSKLEGLAEPPAVEPSLAYHLPPSRRSISASSHISLPGKTERTAAGVYQRIYKYAAQSVCSLNAVTLLSAYQAEVLEEMGRQLDSGAPNPVLWDEICVVNDLLLRSSRGAVQGCGRVMGLAVAGERALWLSLSGLGDTRDTTPPRVSSAQLLRKCGKPAHRESKRGRLSSCVCRGSRSRGPHLAPVSLPRPQQREEDRGMRDRLTDRVPVAATSSRERGIISLGASTLSPRWLRNAALPNPQGVGRSGLPDVPRPSSPLPPLAKRRREEFRAAAPVRFPGASSHGPPR